MRPTKSMVICTLPRSGSYLLCDGLAQTERLGFPAEYYSVAHELYYKRLIDGPKANDYNVVFDYIMRIGMTPNGVFAAKVLLHQLDTLRRNFTASGALPGVAPMRILDRLLPDPHYIHLVRRDKLRQAISYYRAMSSGVWWRFDERPMRVEGKVAYEHRPIKYWYETMQRWEETWPTLLAGLNGPVLTLDYDEVVADYTGTMVRVHDFMGISRGADIAAIRPGLKKQSDDTTEEWVRQFHAIESARVPEPA